MTFLDFEEFIASLNDHRVKYLIVGAYAVGFTRNRGRRKISTFDGDGRGGSLSLNAAEWLL